MATSLEEQLHCTTAYHPQAKGMMNQFNHMLNAALKTCLSDPNWMKELPWEDSEHFPRMTWVIQLLNSSKASQ